MKKKKQKTIEPPVRRMPTKEEKIAIRKKLMEIHKKALKKLADS
jgi:hypothetical protein